MNGRSEVRQRNPIHLRQWDLDRRTGRQCFQVLEDSLYQLVMLSAPVPPQVREDDAIIVQGRFLILGVVFIHTVHVL